MLPMLPTLRMPRSHFGVCVVYVLLCPFSHEIRYVGSTINPRLRKSQHTKRVYLKPKTPVQEWSSRLIQDGTPPIFRIVMRLDGIAFTSFDKGGRVVFRPCVAMRAIERDIIANCERDGLELLNVASTDAVKNLKKRRGKENFATLR